MKVFVNNNKLVVEYDIVNNGQSTPFFNIDFLPIKQFFMTSLEARITHCHKELNKILASGDAAIETSYLYSNKLQSHFSIPAFDAMQKLLDFLSVDNSTSISEFDKSLIVHFSPIEALSMLTQLNKAVSLMPDSEEKPRAIDVVVDSCAWIATQKL